MKKEITSNNAAAAAMMDESLPPATRIRLSREWIRKGVAFLGAGIGQRPRSSALHKLLADIHRETLDDPSAAARHYRLAMGGDAPQSYERRFYGYFLARCPGSEHEAYDFLMCLHAEGESQRKPTLIQRILELEEKLAIPPDKRIPEPDPDATIRRQYTKPQLP